MIDLHLHLDGSLSREDFVYLSKKQHIPLGKDFPNNIYVSKDSSSLEDYLKSFDLPLQLLQTSEALEYVTISLLTRLYTLGYIYAEIRFAPCLHTKKGMSQIKAVDSVVNGLYKFLETHKGFDANIILCCMTTANDMQNKATVNAALEFRNEKVVALDIAGSEKAKSVSKFSSIFKKAIDANFPIICHAGEALGNEEVMNGIKLGAKRIGHGIHVSLNLNTIQDIVMKDVSFEICPTSNMQTHSISSYKDLPIKYFLNHGVKFCINSDNMTVSNTDLLKEYKHIIDEFNLTKDEVKRIMTNAVNMALVSYSEKSRLLALLNLAYDNFYNRIIELNY